MLQCCESHVRNLESTDGRVISKWTFTRQFAVQLFRTSVRDQHKFLSTVVPSVTATLGAVAQQ
jgi:hypothetical protein